MGLIIILILLLAAIFGPGIWVQRVLARYSEPADRYGNTWVYRKSGAVHVLRFTREGQLNYIEKG